MRVQLLADRNLGQVDMLHDRPHDGQATGLSRKGVNLIGASAHMAKQAFNGIRAPNRAMHHRRERRERQKMLFIFTETADGFGIALLLFGECSRPN
jgi:hypothetical protein